MSDDDQGDLFDPDPEWDPVRTSRYLEMLAQWRSFCALNPAVYDELCRIALALRRRGRERWGIGGLFEVLRWQRAMTTTDEDFKLNNNYRAFYARDLMDREPELDNFFELRAQTSRSEGCK